MFLLEFLEKVGRTFIAFSQTIGSVIIFFYKSILSGISPPYYWKQIYQQAIQIGYFSMPVAGMTSLFTGVAMALQCYIGFSELTAETAIPSIVMVAMTRELGPVLTALMISGRSEQAIMFLCAKTNDDSTLLKIRDLDKT
ncbi:MAG: ABC transporter permease [Holosporales bacterium]|jgi:phospholipid/cholesterol/gamma-HCH transport system permease protein|nr:ABC transporter permease [Holosporales bacterium]